MRRRRRTASGSAGSGTSASSRISSQRRRTVSMFSSRSRKRTGRSPCAAAWRSASSTASSSGATVRRAEVARAQPELVARAARSPRRGSRRARGSARPRAQRAAARRRRPASPASTSSYAAIVASVTAGHANRSLIRSRAAAPRRRRSSSSPRSRSSASRSADTSRGGTSRPVSPSTTRSSRPPTAPATTGRPYAIASAHTTPKPSRCDGHATTDARSYSAPSAWCGTNPSAPGTCSRNGPSPATTRFMPDAASTSSRIPFSGESRPANRISGGSAGSATDSGTCTPLGITRTSRAPSSRAAEASACEGQITSRAFRTTRRANPRARRASSTSVPHSCRTNGFPTPAATSPVGQPVRVHEVDPVRPPPSLGAEVPEHRRNHRRQPRPPPQVPHHARPVRDPVVAEVERRDDVHVQPALTQARDRLAEEVHGRVALVARIGRRQHQHLHPRARAKTVGVTSTSIAKT